MKKQFLMVASMVMLVLSMAISVHAQNGGNNGNSNADNALIGRAIAAYRSQCPTNYAGEITGAVETDGICFVSGFIKHVNLFPVQHCPNNQPCPYLVILLGSVDFGCGGEITSVNCGFR
jgi:hypothetical protein